MKCQKNKIFEYDAAFRQLAQPYVGEHYFRCRLLEFRLQQMLLHGIFCQKYRRALDLGCGIGYKALHMTCFADSVVGIDIGEPYHGFLANESAVAVGRRIISEIGCGDVSLFSANFIDHLSAHPSEYDLIYSDYLLEHVPDLPALYSAVSVALEEDGIFMNVVPNTHDALIQFALENMQPSLIGLARAIKGYVKRIFGGAKRHPRLTPLGVLLPVTHSEFISDFREQFDVYRLESYINPMIEAGFIVEYVVPTREHAYTVVCRKGKADSMSSYTVGVKEGRGE